MNSQKCEHCRYSLTRQCYQCCTSAKYCYLCKKKKCPRCGQQNKKVKIVKCKKCYDGIRIDDAFFDFKSQYGEDYYCLKCMRRVYRDSELSVSVFLPVRNTPHDKPDVFEYLKNFCEKCSTKIANQSEAYRNESSGMFLCGVCSKGKPQKKVTRCSVCQVAIGNSSINDSDLPICSDCFASSFHFQKQVEKKLANSRIGKLSHEEDKNKNQQSSQRIKKQPSLSKIEEKEEKDEKISSPKKNKQDREKKSPIQKIENKNEEEINVIIDPESIKQNVPLSLKDIGSEELIQCSRCWYEVCREFVIYDEKIKENLCRGCYVVNNKSENGYKNKVSSLREPVEQPKHRNYTKEKPFTTHHESPKKNTTKLSSLYSYGTDYQMPDKYKNLTSTTKKQQDYSYVLNGMTSLHNKKKCPSCGRPLAFPNSTYCVQCQRLRKKPRY